MGPDVASSMASSGWSRSDFETALPLYVGGDLAPEESARVDAWLLIHPEDQGELEAAMGARQVLADHAEAARSQTTPDLWPSVRAELAQAGLLGDGRVSSPVLEAPDPSQRSIAAGTSGQPIAGDDRNQGALLGGASFFRRPGVAAAAALLLVGGIGFLMSGPAADRGNGGAVPSGATPASAGAGNAVASGTVGPAGVGRLAAPAEVRLAGSKVGRGAPLTPQGSGAEHLLDQAPRVPYWQQGTQVIHRVEFPGTTGEAAELVGDRRR